MKFAFLSPIFPSIFGENFPNLRCNSQKKNVLCPEMECFDMENFGLNFRKGVIFAGKRLERREQKKGHYTRGFFTASLWAVSIFSQLLLCQIRLKLGQGLQEVAVWMSSKKPRVANLLPELGHVVECRLRRWYVSQQDWQARCNVRARQLKINFLS